MKKNNYKYEITYHFKIKKYEITYHINLTTYESFKY